MTNNAAPRETSRDQPGVFLIDLGKALSAEFSAVFEGKPERSCSHLRVGPDLIAIPAEPGDWAVYMDVAAVSCMRAMMEASAQFRLLVNRTRFGRSALHLLADLREFSAVITDADPFAREAAVLQHAGITLKIAREEP